MIWILDTGYWILVGLSAQDCLDSKPKPTLAESSIQYPASSIPKIVLRPFSVINVTAKRRDTESIKKLAI
jgi:hypothetical protein